MEYNTNLVTKERSRIEAEYKRREIQISADLYAPWQPGEILMSSERKRVAAMMLKRSGRFPKAGDHCLEIGYGKLGWLSDLISWGMRETDLYGIELDSDRAKKAQEALPNAHLEIGDAVNLPWEDGRFKLIVASTVFSSILDQNVRNLIAQEITRVLSPKGIFLWYDVAVNNPRNKNLKCIKRNELKQLFPYLDCEIKSITLAPPISRIVSSRSWALATVLSAIPLLRTHLVGAFIKK